MASYSLTSRQSRLYQDRADLYERTRAKTGGTPGDESWSLVASDIPYYHQGSVTLLLPGVTGMPTDDDMITMDRGHFPAGVPFIGNPGDTAMQMIVNRSTGTRASHNGSYAVAGAPWPVDLKANKQVIFLREEDFNPNVDADFLAAGTITASAASDTSANVFINPATGGVGPWEYLLEYQIDGDTAWTEYGTVSAAETTLVEGLSSGTTYLFRVTATDQINTSDTVTSDPVTLPAPLAAVLTAPSTTLTSVSLALAVSGGTSPYSIQFQYKLTSSGTWLDWGSAGTATTTDVTGLTSGTSYDFRAQVTDSLPATLTSNVVTQSTGVNPYNTNLVAAWPLNGDYLDVSGNGFTLTPVNAPTFVSGLVGSGAVQLQASLGQYLTHASDPLLQLNGGSHTIMVRVNLATKPGVFVIASKDNNNTVSGDRAWSLAFYTSALRYNIFDAGGSVIADPTIGTLNVPTGTVLTIIARYNASTGKANLRVNATSSADYTVTGTPNTNTSPIRFGADSSGASHAMDGVLDSPTLWTRYLSDAECDTLISGNLEAPF